MAHTKAKDYFLISKQIKNSNIGDINALKNPKDTYKYEKVPNKVKYKKVNEKVSYRKNNQHIKKLCFCCEIKVHIRVD